MPTFFLNSQSIGPLGRCYRCYYPLGRDDLGVATQIRFLHKFYKLRNRMESLDLYGKSWGWLLYPPTEGALVTDKMQLKTTNI